MSSMTASWRTRSSPTALDSGFWKIDGYQLSPKPSKRTSKRAPVKIPPISVRLAPDNRVAARKLAKSAHAWLTAWRQSSGNANAKLILIAHSMGGLVSRYFLECLEGWKDTRALVTSERPIADRSTRSTCSPTG